MYVCTPLLQTPDVDTVQGNDLVGGEGVGECVGVVCKLRNMLWLTHIPPCAPPPRPPPIRPARAAMDVVLTADTRPHSRRLRHTHTTALPPRVSHTSHFTTHHLFNFKTTSHFPAHHLFNFKTTSNFPTNNLFNFTTIYQLFFNPSCI